MTTDLVLFEMPDDGPRHLYVTGVRSSGPSGDGGAPRRRRHKGPAEKAALADLRKLRAEGKLPPATKSLQLNFRLAARNVDRAEDMGDVYAVVAASRELATRRAQLSALDAIAPEGETDDLFDRLSAEIRDAS